MKPSPTIREVLDWMEERSRNSRSYGSHADAYEIAARKLREAMGLKSLSELEPKSSVEFWQDELRHWCDARAAEAFVRATDPALAAALQQQSCGAAAAFADVIERIGAMDSRNAEPGSSTIAAETEPRGSEIAAELLEALKGVVAVADRSTPEFDRARAVITRATPPSAGTGEAEAKPTANLTNPQHQGDSHG